MKVLMISTDRNIFDSKSGARQRILGYGSFTRELHIIVFTLKGFNKKKISDKVTIYPTNSKNRWFYVFDALRVSRNIKDVELVTTQDPFETGLVGGLIAKKRGVKLQLQIHTDFLSPYFAKDGILNKVRVVIARFLLPKADCVRVVSERIKASIKNSGLLLRSEPVVLPIFVDVEIIRNIYTGVDLHTKYHQFDNIILMVSRLEKEKNIPLALSSLKQVIRKYPKTGLVIIGEGREREALKLKIKKYKLEDNVVLEGGGVEVVPFYKTADIFLHTSNYEGYGIVFVEASLLGCPIVTTSVGIVDELFKDGGNAYLCDISDENCLAQKIIKLIEDKKLRNKFAIEAENSINNFIKEKTKQQYLEKYKNMWGKCLNR